MAVNIFIYELKSTIKSIVTWTFSMVLLALVFLGVYPVFMESADDVKKLLAAFPPGVLKAFGFDISAIFSPVGFYSLFFTYIVLCGSIQAMILGISSVAKEFVRKTADFLLTKPVSRISIITGKILAGLTALLITHTLTIGIIRFLFVYAGKESVDGKLYMALSATLFFVAMMFFTLGILSAVIFQRIKSAAAVSTGAVLGFFLLGMFGSVISDDAIRYFAPFKYYDPVRIISGSGYETVFVVINIIFVAAGIAASYIIYAKMDIRAA